MAQQTPWAILRCKWDGTDDEPLSDTYLKNMFTTAGAGTPNMVEFFDLMSHGKIDVSGSEVFDWITLPYKQSDYAGNVVTAPAGKINRTGLVASARATAAAAGIDVTKFFGAVIVMNTPTDLFGEFGGWGAVCDELSCEPFLVAQEMLHVYGLDHSRERKFPDQDYRDLWDTMSAGMCHYIPGGPYGRWGPGLNAANMRDRGWLKQSRVLSLRSTPPFAKRTVQLRPLHARELSGYLAIQVDDNFTIEFRDLRGWDTAGTRAGILVHTFEDNHSYLEAGPYLGQDEYTKGTKWKPLPDLDYIQFSVDDIDEAGRVATLTFKPRPGKNIHDELLVGGDLSIPWVDGGGFVGSGSTVIISPPGDKLSPMLAKLVTYRSADGLRDVATRAAVQREVMEDLATFAHAELERLNASVTRSPAPPKEADPA
jgi:hypothetical protein